MGGGLEVGLTLLINELSTLSKEIALVLDDFQVMENPVALQGIGFLLKYLPPNLHLIIASRSEPELDLAFLRAKGRVVELGADEMRFTVEEVAQYFQEAVGLQLSPEMVQMLEERTDGWITSLQMAAISLKHQAEPAKLLVNLQGRVHYLEGFLAEEVLDQQPEDIRQFLLRSSILDTLNGPLCEAVVNPDAQPGYGAVMLNRLEHAQLFISALDDKHEWFRYHSLFTDFLRQVEAQVNPGEIPELNKRAALWLEGNGNLGEAFRYALASRDMEWAAALIERMIAVFTALVGVLNVLSAVTPAQADRLAALDRLLPLTVQHGGRLTAALSGFALLILSNGLWRRKQTAWLLALVVLVISSISFLIEGLNYEASLLAAGLAVWLLAMRDQFQVRSDPPSVRQGFCALLSSVSFTLAFGVTGFYLLDRHYSVNFSFWDAVRQTIVMFTQFYDPGLQPVTGFGRYFAASIYVVGAATMIFALLMLIRPVIIRQPVAQEERERARRIVENYGCSSLARYTLFEDKSYFFSKGGSLVVHTEKGRIGVALGDPIGPAQDVSSVIGEFKEYCEKNDWQPAFYQVLPDNLERYREAGFDVLCIGHEAIVDLRTFTLEGKKAKDLRYAYNRYSRLGYQAIVHEPPLPDHLLTELRSISDEWLKMMRGSEKRFSLGWFEESYIRSSPVIAVHTPDGRISAFANINSEYPKNEANVDLMRRRQEAESGTMDYLFAALLLWAKSKGYETFNLGLSSLSGVGENPGDPAVERAMHYIYEHINQFYNFKGLHEFKEKFNPTWSPRYLIYPGADSLLPSALAVTSANAGENPIRSYVKRK